MWDIFQFLLTSEAPFSDNDLNPLIASRLDGFNKNMNPADISFYGQQFNSLCKTLNAPSIQYPEGKGSTSPVANCQCSTNIPT